MKKHLLMLSALTVLLATAAALELDFFAWDKARHMIVSLALLAGLFSFRLFFRSHRSEAVALVLSIRDLVIIGIAKELFDAMGFGDPEWMDLLADSIGIALPVIGFLCAEVLDVGIRTFVHSHDTAVHPALKRIGLNEEHYFARQCRALRHEGFSLLWKI